MTEKERTTYLKARLRNLKRKYNKLITETPLFEEIQRIKKEIDNIEKELN